MFQPIRTLLLFSIIFAGTGIATADEPAGKKSDKPRVMTGEITLPRPTQDARRFRKPYVAVWIRDKDDFPVRTLVLWVQKAQPGPRWIPDLRQWYRDEKLREYVDDTNLIDAVSGATRGAGTYKFSWDGLDDQGKPVKPGTYTLLVEAAREHGTYQVAKENVEFGSDAWEKKLGPNPEIESVVFSYTGKLAESAR